MDTSTAKKAIFERIRSAHQRPPQPTQAELDAVQEYLRQPSVGPQPAIGPDIVRHFTEQAQRMSDTVAQVGSIEEVPTEAARYLKTIGVAPKAIGWQTLRGLPWVEAGLEMEFRPPVNEDMVGVTGSFCAVAETGTLLLLSGRETYPSASLLPETHIAIVYASRIVRAMEEAFALVRSERGELPRAANFISGPSRTADIEQSIVLGAHGPYRVHVIIVLDQ